MNVTLQPELKAFVEAKVQAGDHDSVNDVINYALHVLREQERQEREDFDPQALEELRRQVDVGLAELDRGEGREWDGEGIKAEGRRLLAAEHAAKLRKAE
jgi:putative addiction module CopG family antidote